MRPIVDLKNRLSNIGWPNSVEMSNRIKDDLLVIYFETETDPRNISFVSSIRDASASGMARILTAYIAEFVSGLTIREIIEGGEFTMFETPNGENYTMAGTLNGSYMFKNIKNGMLEHLDISLAVKRLF